MKPYRQHTPMRLRFVRRLRYGRGHGIHSPRAYALVHSIIRPRHRYYASVSGALNALLYRIVARLSPSVCIVDGASSTSIDFMRTTFPQLPILEYPQYSTAPSGRRLLLTSSPEHALELMTDMTQECFVLLTDIRASRQRYLSFRSLPRIMKRGTLIDLYECALLYNSDNELYVYRSSL